MACQYRIYHEPQTSYLPYVLPSHPRLADYPLDTQGKDLQEMRRNQQPAFTPCKLPIFLAMVQAFLVVSGSVVLYGIRDVDVCNLDDCAGFD